LPHVDDLIDDKTKLFLVKLIKSLDQIPLSHLASQMLVGSMLVLGVGATVVLAAAQGTD
jgi:hypothetical protein